MQVIKKMSTTSSNIKEPGLNVLPPGVERYTLNGGGITGIQILPEDEIEVINNEGNQICEISIFLSSFAVSKATKSEHCLPAGEIICI